MERVERSMINSVEATTRRRKEEGKMKLLRRSTIELFGLLVLSGLFFLTGPLLAADVDYPTKPVTVISGFSPGGSNSITAHVVLESLPRYSTKPQKFIIVHKPGAASMIAADYLMKQPADGYTLMWMDSNCTSNLAKDPQKYSFGLKDFTYIGTFSYFSYCLAVASERPFKTIEDFIDYAKKHPWELTASTPGVAGGSHLTLERLMKQAGVKITHVPFPSGSAGRNAMLGGHVTCYIGSYGTFSSHAKAGRVRTLVVFGPERYAPIPEVPTAKEKGYDVALGGYFRLIAKKGTPKPILDYLVNLFKQMGNDSTVKSKLLTNAQCPPKYMGPEETEKFTNQEFEFFSDMFKQLGLVGK